MKVHPVLFFVGFIVFVVLLATFIGYICKRDMTDEEPIDYASVELVAKVVSTIPLEFPPKHTPLKAYCMEHDSYIVKADGEGGSYHVLDTIKDQRCVALLKKPLPPHASYQNYLGRAVPVIPLT